MKLSIITINLNNAHGLKKTIESVVSQTFNDYEYIIIDGGSVDGSVETIKQYADKITYWVSEPDKGIYNAMNKGILQAKGEYCLFLNSGDYLCDSSVLDKFNEGTEKYDIVYANIIFENENSKREQIYCSEDQLTAAYFFRTSLPHSGGSLIKRALFLQYGLYDESLKIVSDWRFFMNAILTKGAKVRHLNFFSAVFDGRGISNDNQLRIKERDKVLYQDFYYFLKDYEELNIYKSSLTCKILRNINSNRIIRNIKKKLLGQ